VWRPARSLRRRDDQHGGPEGRVGGRQARGLRQGGPAAKVGAALADDPDFLRKLKPSLIAARAKGEAPTNEPAGGVRSAPSAPRFEQQKRRGGGPSPWLVIGAALVVGYAVAKAIDWRAHAHPRD